MLAVAWRPGRPLAGRRRLHLEHPRGRAAADGPSGRAWSKRRKTEQAHICLGTDGLARNDPDRFAFGVVNTALGGGMSSRLFQEIREKRGLAYSVYSYHSQFAEAGHVHRLRGHDAGPRGGGARDPARELEDVARGPHREELERAKGHMKGSLVLSLEDPGGRMSRLGKSEIAHGEILSVSQMLRGSSGDARGRAARGRAGTLAADDADGARTVPEGDFKEVMA